MTEKQDGCCGGAMPFFSGKDHLMQYIVNSSEMKTYDTNTADYFKVPSIVLMERAALAFVDELARQNVDTKRALVVCGAGNNGGDGLAVARLLAQKKSKVTVVYAGDRARATELNRLQLEILSAYGIPVKEEITQDCYTVVIDALFGVGLDREVSGDYAEKINQMNRLCGYKAAIDISSGLSADTGKILGTAFCADLTVAFAFAKCGMMFWPGAEYAGKVSVREIGIDENSFLGKVPRIRMLEEQDIPELLPKRFAHSHKGTYGKLLLIAGSVNMAGAAILAAKAAYAAGCGLVKVLTPAENRLILQTAVPEAVIETYDKDGEKMDLPAMISWADAVVAGPGLGVGSMAQEIVETVLKETKKPVLLDADALNIIAKSERLLHMLGANNIITPHVGEMARLTGKDIQRIEAGIADTAKEMSEKYHTVCVLKDFRTVSALPDGELYLNTTGNSGMATAGSGDVLSGLIGSLLAQGAAPGMAAALGVYLHGMAGDKKASCCGERGLTAADLAEGLKQIWKNVERTE